MQFNRRKKVAAATGMAAVAALAVVGGTLAQFTDSDTTEAQVLKAGTVEVNAVEGANWDTSGLILAIDDVVTRNVTLANTSTLALGGLNLTANTTSVAGPLGGNLEDAVTVDIIQKDAVTGAVVKNLATDVKVSALTSYPLQFDSAVAPGTDVTLEFVYDVVGATATEGDFVTGDREGLSGNLDNQFQGAEFSATYTIDAIQRDGIVQ